MDENTIGVVVIAGTTYTGVLEPVEEVAAALDRFAADGGPDVPLHVIMRALSSTAQWFAGQIAEEEEEIDVLTDGSAIPVVTVKVNDPCPFRVFDISYGLRVYGW